jgi:GT2 family glycosyltransferase
MHIQARMRICVLVPSYRRTPDLKRCLSAIRAQQRPPDSVVVTVRLDDHPTEVFIDELSVTWPELQCVLLDRPGVVAAMNAGLAAADADVLALTDDDAEPESDWLGKMESVFANRPDVAGVGGRDVQEGVAATATEVGRVQWFGRVIGNHHTGMGAAREVDVLKGANCAFRMGQLRELGFDERLRGSGAQVHWEMSLCLQLRRAGWKLIYDPAIRVLHHVGARQGEDQLHRGRFDVGPHEDAVFNGTLVLAENLRGARGLAFRAWTVLVGTRSEPGLLQVPRALLHEGRTASIRFAATQRARRAGFRAAGISKVRQAPTGTLSN